MASACGEALYCGRSSVLQVVCALWQAPNGCQGSQWIGHGMSPTWKYVGHKLIFKSHQLAPQWTEGMWGSFVTCGSQLSMMVSTNERRSSEQHCNCTLSRLPV